MALTIADIKRKIQASRTSAGVDMQAADANNLVAERAETISGTSWRADSVESTSASSAETGSIVLDAGEDDEANEPPAHPLDVPTVQPAELDARGLTDFNLVHVPLDQVRIDPHQPRKYLPLDLRSKLAQNELTARQVIAELIERVNHGDAEATTYFNNIRELAESVADVGLRQPIQVTRVREKSGQVVYRLIDGERRFWACVLLRATLPAHKAADFESVAMSVEDDEATGDDVIRAQWTSNLQHADIPTVDFAEFVHETRDLYARRMAMDERPLRGQLGPEWRGACASDVVTELSAREIERITKRKLAHRSIRLYCAVAEQLDERAKAAARTHDIGLRQLDRIAKLPREVQAEAVLRARLDSDDDAEEKTTTGDRDMQAAQPKVGRPQKLDSQITLLTKVTMDVSKRRDKMLRQADPTKLQHLRQIVEETVQSLTEYRKQIERCLVDSGSES